MLGVGGDVASAIGANGLDLARFVFGQTDFAQPVHAQAESDDDENDEHPHQVSLERGGQRAGRVSLASATSRFEFAAAH